ncbi:hypothetical protein PRK78_004823 [Emydomyces testavorans]|uniref:Uncharacterized protein n=1 Tax=Emydomyces testavorans TaxID=2070801 RepID=A0AAF0IJJ1_9EURO|nr:hypothetical protein PRK78_004823 [Emydomyces testavorans]
MHGSIVSPAASSLRCHPRILGQRRTISWREYRTDSDWQSRFGAKMERSIEKANRVLSYKYSCMLRPRLKWHRLQNGGVWDWIRPRSSSSPKKPDDDYGWSPWGWNKSAWEKEFASEQDRFERQFEEFKRRIDADAYGMIFGRRLQRLRPSPGLKDDIFPSFCRSIFDIYRGTASSKGSKRQPNENKPVKPGKPETGTCGTSSLSRNETMFQFDPISGRMVPKDDPNFGTHKESLGRTTDSIIDIPVTTYRSKSMSNGKQSSSVESSATAAILGHKKSSDELGLRQETDQDNGLVDSKLINDASSQQKSNGVWLMGGPQSQSGINDPGRSSTTTCLDSDAKAKLSSSSATYFEDKKPGQLTSGMRSAHSLFANFREYLTSKFETYGYGRDVKPSIPSVKEMNLKHAPCKALPASHNALYEDPERLNIESLRADDVRASFDRRNYEHEAQKWERETDNMMKSGSFDQIEKDGISNGNPDTGCSTAYLTADFGKSYETIQDKDKRLVEEIRTIYEDAYGEITPMHRQTEIKYEGDGFASTTSSEAKIQTGPRNLHKLDTVLDKVEQTDNAVQSSLQELESLCESMRREVLVNAKPADGIQQNAPAKYKILAYDSSTMKVRDAGITSSFTSPFVPLHPVEAITRLNHPSKFLGFFPLLTKQGYEVFSASDDVLVFRKTKGGGIESVVVNEADTPASESDSVHSPAQAAVLAKEFDDECKTNKSTPDSETEPKLRRFDGTRATSEHVHMLKESAKLTEASSEKFETDQGGPENSPNPKSSSAQGGASDDASKKTVYSQKQGAQHEQESVEASENSTLKAPSSHPESKPIMVRRQETHFTGGPPNWSPYDPDAESRRPPPPPPPSSVRTSTTEAKESSWSFLRKAFRRAFFAGVITGGTCYAIGVVAEYFRTGGQDGLGPRGFTGLEGR